MKNNNEDVEGYKVPTIQWVRPAPPQSLIQRSFATDENKAKNNPNRFIMFDEIFPGKKNNANDEKSTSYKETDDTFHRAMIPVLTIGQCFGILPVAGIRKPDATFLKFSWFSWRVGFTLLSMVGSANMAFFCVLIMIYKGVDIYKTISVMFYLSTFTVLVLFLRLSPHWPALGLAVARRERVRPAMLRNRPNRRSLRSKFNICCFAVLVPALIEHLLAIFSGIAVADDCRGNRTLAESYFINSYSFIFYFTSFSPLKGFTLQIINLESTFNWNFMDLFIITVSLGLTDRFIQLNERLQAIKGKVEFTYFHLPEQYWKAAREEFAHLSRLVKEVDGAINEIVLLSFANNLYFICLQLFNSLKSPPREGCVCRPLRGMAHAIYFTFSFSFLMTRSLAVSLCAARIHTASRQPATILYAAPSSSYGAELQRFLEQVVTDTVALTGLNFFHVTRGLVLTIAGTIVTYELVLVQFNASPPPVTANITINDNCGIPIRT